MLKSILPISATSVGLVGGLVGFGGVAALATGIAHVLWMTFLLVYLTSMFAKLMRAPVAG